MQKSEALVSTFRCTDIIKLCYNEKEFETGNSGEFV